MHNKKIFALLYLAILALSIVAFVPPVAHATITGRPIVYYNNQATDPLGVPAGEQVSISFKEVSVTGAQIWIWLSKTGGATIEPYDKVYVGPIYIGDVYSIDESEIEVKVWPPFDEYMGETIKVKVGKGGWVNLTLPKIVEGGDSENGPFYWIKVTDVHPSLGTQIPSSDVAVSDNRLYFMPAYHVTPTGDVVPDQEVTIGGYATPVGAEYNITLFYTEPVSQASIYYKLASFVESKHHTVDGWNWTGFEVKFKMIDLKLRYNETVDYSVPITVNIVNATDPSDVKLDQPLLSQPPRKVWLPTLQFTTDTLREHGKDYSDVFKLETGKEYNVTLAYFPSSGSVSIYLNNTLVASGIKLNETGWVFNYTIKVPNVPKTGNYYFRVVDNHGVEYKFLVKVEVVPYIEVEPSAAHVGDKIKVIGHYFQDYIGDRYNIWFLINETHYQLLKNFTISAAHWTVEVTIPNALGGKEERVFVRPDVPGTPSITDNVDVSNAYAAEFEVLPKVEVIPSEFTNDGSKVVAKGTGLGDIAGESEDARRPTYRVAIDNIYLTDAKPDKVGVLAVEFVAAGFTPGLHAVALYEPEYTNVTVVGFFTVTGTSLEDIATDIEDIKTGVDDLKEMLTQLGDQLVLKLEEVNESLATIVVKEGDEVIAEITARLDELEPVITDVAGDVAYVRTVVGEMVLDVDELVDGQAEIKSLITTAKGDVVASISTAKGDILAELSTIEELISSGVKADTAKILSEISALKTAIKDSEILSKLEELAATLEDVSSKVAGIDDIKSTVVDVKSAVSDLAGMEEDIKSYIDDAAKDVKDSVSGTVSAYGIAGIVLAIIVLALVALSIFRKRE